MSVEGEKPGFASISGEERAQLERLWAEGRLRRQHEKLLAFVREQHVEILQLAGGRREPAALTFATCKLIATLRTVHHQSEMQDQMRAIHDEIWYCGQRGDHDHRRIQQDWVERHGSNWRNWRIKEYFFLAGHCAAEIAAGISAT